MPILTKSQNLLSSISGDTVKSTDGKFPFKEFITNWSASVYFYVASKTFFTYYFSCQE